MSEGAAVAAYRAEVRADLGLSPDISLEAFAFGDGGALADELAELVVSGPKRATVGWIAEAEALGEHLPRPGDYWIILDGAGRPRCTIRTVETFEAPLLAVDERFAWDEGEGERTREWWLDAHRRYFERRAAVLGLPFDAAASPLLYERFEVVHRAGAAARATSGRTGAMRIDKLDHVNLRTANLAAMRAFYTEVLGMTEGPRPPFAFGGAWLYSGQGENRQATVHLVEVAGQPVPEGELRLEHFAFAAQGLADFLATLKQRGEAYRIGVVPGFGIIQVNLHDPDGNHIHVDFAAAEATSVPDEPALAGI